MSQTADQLLVIGRGRIIAAGPVQQVPVPRPRSGAFVGRGSAHSERSASVAI
jgi:hypothetical protein